MPTITELAEARSRAAKHMNSLGATNAAGRTSEEQVAASARYRMATDAYLKASRDYDAAISNLSADELLKLSR